MTRLPRACGKDVVAALHRAGFELSHVRGSHHYLRRPGEGPIVPVPIHGNKTLPAGTMAAILRLAGLSPEEFAQLLR